MPLTEGATFAGYTVKKPLGQGGMASVFEVWEGAPLNRFVALKVLPQRLLRDPDFSARMVAEAAVLAQLEYPTIVPVYRAGIAEETPWIAMRLLRGGSLFDLARLGRIPLPQILKILRSVADALDYAHGQPHPIVHRDVKPANVLLDLKGNAYLSDFGIADLLQGTTVLVDTFQAMSAAAGTPPYMPSEQSAGRHVAQSDVYALGITAYELLTGQLPFMGRSYDEIRRKHANDPVPIPDPAVVSAALLQPVLKALEKDYRRRWASAGEFVRALDEAARAGDRLHTVTFPSYELQFGPVVSLEAEEIQETQSQMASGFLGMQFKRLDDDFDLSNIEVRLFAVDEATGSRRILSKRVSPLKAGQHVFFKAWEVMNDGAYEVQVANPGDGSLLARGRFEVVAKSPGPQPTPRNTDPPAPEPPRPSPTPPTPPNPPLTRHPAETMANVAAVLAVIGLVSFFTPFPLVPLVLSVLAIRMAQQSGQRILKRSVGALVMSVVALLGGTGIWYSVYQSSDKNPSQPAASGASPVAPVAAPAAPGSDRESVDGFVRAVAAIGQSLRASQRRERVCGQLDVASFAGGGEVRHLVPATLDLESQSKGGSEADAPEWSFLTTPPLQLVLNGTRAVAERSAAIGTIGQAGGPYLAIFQADKRAWPKVPLQRPNEELSFTSGQFEGWIVIADRRTAQPVCEGTLSVSNSNTVNFPPGDAQSSALRARSAVFDDFRARFTEQSAERVRAMSAGQLRLQW